MRTIYVAATGQHVGKTTSTLGIVANLWKRGFRTGYSKPLGQKSLNINGVIADKDAFLFSDVIGFDIHPEWHSPVVISHGVTKRYIEDPASFDFQDRVMTAAKYLSKECDIAVYEGTGHPGVGSVVDLSNAQVAKMIRAGVIMVVEGGIGSTIDRLNLSLALFRQQNVPILGVIVNKVIPEKTDQVRYYLGKKLGQAGISLLGVVPYDATLSFPIMETINHAVQGKVILNGDFLNNRVEDIVSGSLVDLDEFDELKTFQNLLLVVSIKRLNAAIEKVKAISRMKNINNSPLSGIIVTGDGRHARWYDEADFSNPYFDEHQIPILTTKLDTFGTVVKINRIEVKINTRTPWKSKRAIELIEEYVDFDLLLQKLDLQKKLV